MNLYRLNVVYLFRVLITGTGYSESMDKRTLELLALAGKLRQYSDNDVVILRTGPLAEILDSIESETDPEQPAENVNCDYF